MTSEIRLHIGERKTMIKEKIAVKNHHIKKTLIENMPPCRGYFCSLAFAFNCFPKNNVFLPPHGNLCI